MSKKSNNNSLKNWVLFKDALISFFLVILVVVASLNFIEKIRGKKPTIFGYSTLYVVSGSMSPTFKVGEFLIMKKVPYESIKIDDIITFTADVNNDGIDDLVTHRVVEIKIDGTLVTRGDFKIHENVEVPTEEVTNDNYIGKIVFNSFFLGKTFANKNLFMIIVALLFGYLIFIQINSIIKTIKKEQKIIKEKENSK